jgi:hypothetical protein
MGAYVNQQSVSVLGPAIGPDLGTLRLQKSGFFRATTPL